MPVDWKSSHTRTLHLLTLNLSEKGVSGAGSEWLAVLLVLIVGQEREQLLVPGCGAASSCQALRLAHSCCRVSTAVPLLAQSDCPSCVPFCMAAKFCHHRSSFFSAYRVEIGI